MNNILKYLNTIKYLKLSQLFWQVLYRIRKRTIFKPRYSKIIDSLDDCTQIKLVLDESLPCQKFWLSNQSFCFLNIDHSFRNKIDWEFSDLGKLWTYNLNYHDFLLQGNTLANDKGLALIEEFVDYIDYNELLQTPLEPYPVSLRIINWVKFFIKNDVEVPEKVNKSLYAQSVLLTKNFEKHLLGNHYLENGFALLFAAYYFQDERFYHIASGILKSELEEQILSDGGHFELSPMYHQIILYRVLDCYNLVKNNSWQECELLSILKEKAGLMLGWLEQVTFSNGDIPLVNDAIVGIAPTSKQLCNYAGRLNLKSKKTKLKECGYRKICSSNYELFCDVGKVGPDYIPGHAHADTLSFLLYVTGKPLIVDPGISTYEKNDCRQKERSTESHNTIVINDTNSSDVWGGFRVANRAKIVDIEEGEGFIRATHEGYKKIGALHKRIFEYNESGLEIYDEISSKNSIKCKAFFHFAPGVEPEIDDGVISLPKAIMSFVGSEKIELFDYDFSDGFNKLTPAKAVRVYFNKELKSTVLIAYGTDGKTRKTDKKYIKSFAQ